MKRRTQKVLISLLVLAMVIGMLAGCSNGSSASTPSANTSTSAPSDSGAGTDTAKSYHFRIANVVQEDNPMNQACVSFINMVEEETNGRITFDNYPARQLGEDSELFAQVQSGALDMALVSAADVGATNELAAALQIPFLFNSLEQYQDVVSNKVTDNLLAGLDVNNVSALAVWNAGNRYLCSPNGFIRVPDDIKGQKIRVANTPLCMDIFTAIGSAPTVIEYGEMYTGLQNKVIDVIEMDIFAIEQEKFFEVVKYITPADIYTWPAIFMVNKDLFESMSPEDQQLFKDCAKKTIAENVNYIDTNQQKLEETLKGQGIQFGEPMTAEERALWEDKVSDVIEKWSAKDSRIADFVNYALSTQ